MALMSVRATYALDRDTADAIRSLAGRWKTSQAEVIRRAVKSAAAQIEAQPTRMTPMEVVEYYRKNGPTRTAAETRAVIAQLRADRLADEDARQQRVDVKPRGKRAK
ncbi:MAG: hypothetical protein JWQ90_4741 [Hydrocarboniphaga sp.]|uniref:hypothetical protein n=1 Tax=Hydrocarboniphaga sp. TaxID=2033016 RepID=UPI0026205A3B|nr:hypothetical protein [Hydrocarboniphaga sp.]MDB5972291.1 hypothetical protein [Hydrocarboniphaga sp.]